MIQWHCWLEAREKSEKYGLPKDIKKARKKKGGSNVGKNRKTSPADKGPFCGPAGGAPKGSYPVTNMKQARAAKAYARHAPNPEGIKRCVDRIVAKWKKNKKRKSKKNKMHESVATDIGLADQLKKSVDEALQEGASHALELMEQAREILEEFENLDIMDNQDLHRTLDHLRTAIRECEKLV